MEAKTREEAEEPEPELEKRITMISKLAEGLGFGEVGIKVLEDFDSNKHHAAMFR